ncbi:MAG TPA: hypothetical protein VFS79_09000 [Arthrobacter sp.]|nr:hypothetical protein [Arthrobacter sp.]
MSPSSPAFRAVSATASAAVLALAVSLSAAGAAAAETSDPSAPACDASCTLEPTTTRSGDGRNDKPKGPDEPPGLPGGASPAPPAAPEPAVPAAPAPAAPAAPEAPAPEETTPAESAAPETTASEPGTTPSSSPSTESNWNKPVTRSPKATQAGAVTRGGPGLDGTSPLAITAGVLLVGAGGLAFAWWGRNRVRAH